jgi:hypothetical protein
MTIGGILICLFLINTNKVKMKKIYLLFLFVGFIAGCQEEEEPKIPEQQKDNLVENQMTYHNYKDSVTFHQTTKIYVHSQLVKTNESTFTLPALGTKTIQVEDENGNKRDTVVAIPYGISFRAKEEK